jgi:hypothetical protein
MHGGAIGFSSEGEGKGATWVNVIKLDLIITNKAKLFIAKGIV